VIGRAGETWREHVKKSRAEFIGRYLILTLLGPKGCHDAICRHHLLGAGHDE
jgi:hypothetical protein